MMQTLHERLIQALITLLGDDYLRAFFLGIVFLTLGFPLSSVKIGLQVISKKFHFTGAGALLILILMAFVPDRYYMSVILCLASILSATEWVIRFPAKHLAWSSLFYCLALAMFELSRKMPS